MQTVKDRPGHDRRYALSSEKLMRETNWKAIVPFEEGLRATTDWYRSNTDWTARIKKRRVSKLLQKQLRRTSRIVPPIFRELFVIS